LFCLSWIILVKWTVWFLRWALQLFVDNSFNSPLDFASKPYGIHYNISLTLLQYFVFENFISDHYTCRSDVQACRILKLWNRFQTLSKWRHETVINIMCTALREIRQPISYELVRRNNKLLVTARCVTSEVQRTKTFKRVKNVQICQILFFYVLSWPMMTWREGSWITYDTWVRIKIYFYRTIRR